MERKFVVIRRALGNTAFTTSNRLDEMNNLYGVSIKSVISPFTDRYGNGYITGLDEAEEALFEKKLKLEKGTLAKRSEFWTKPELQVHVDGTSARIFIDEPMGELKWKMVKAQPIVAPSMGEYNSIKHSFVMYEPEVEAELEMQKNNVEIDAINEFTKLNEEQIREVSTFYKLSTRGLVLNIAKANLYKEVKKAPKKFIALLKDPHYKSKLFVNQLVREGVLKHTSKGYYNSDDQTIPIAYSMGEFVEKLADPNNDDLKVNLKQKLAQAIKVNNK